MSACARDEMRVPDIVDVCVARGLRHIGITDHIFPSTDPGILRQTRQALSDIDTDREIDLCLGCEADVTAVGSHTVSAEVEDVVDYVMVSSNHYQLPWVDSPKGLSTREVAEHFLRMFAYACSLGAADVIAHPLCEVSGAFDRDCLNAISDSELKEALAAAKENAIAMEISPRSLTKMHPGFRLRFYGLCREVGVKFAVGSDAHSLESVGKTSVLRGLIDELGITDEEIWLPGTIPERRRQMSGNQQSGRT